MSVDIERPQAQPESDRVWSIERNGIEPIPESERHGRPFDLFWVWAAANISILGISYGTYLPAFYSLNLWQALVAGLLGTGVSFLLVGFISLAGKKGSAPTLVLSRAAFGVKGNIVPTAVSWIALVGWEIVLVALATLAAEAILDRLNVASGDGVLAVAFVLIAGATIAVGLLGHATIVRLQTIFTYAFAVLTVVFIAFTIPDIEWSKVSALPSGSLLAGFVGGMSVVMAGLGIGWVNAGADYSRYLPRSASSGGVVGWTTFGASLPLLVLIPLGILLAAGQPGLASSGNFIGDLAKGLPTWFLVPYLLTAVGGLLAGAVLDIYSSGLNLLTLGVKIPRHVSVAFDGILMILGNIYILFIAKDFITPFIGFLVTLGVLLASWAAIFLVDFLMFRRDGYLERDLYDPAGRYGAINPAGLIAFVVASVIGLGLVVSTASVFRWVGFLLWFPGMGGKQGAIAFSSIGLFIAFLVAGILYAVLSLSRRASGRESVVAAAR